MIKLPDGKKNRKRRLVIIDDSHASGRTSPRKRMDKKTFFTMSSIVIPWHHLLDLQQKQIKSKHRNFLKAPRHNHFVYISSFKHSCTFISNLINQNKHFSNYSHVNQQKICQKMHNQSQRQRLSMTKINYFLIEGNSCFSKMHQSQKFFMNIHLCWLIIKIYQVDRAQREENEEGPQQQQQDMMCIFTKSPANSGLIQVNSPSSLMLNPFFVQIFLQKNTFNKSRPWIQGE